MKKKCNSGGLMKIRLRKTLLVMKFVLFFLLSVSVSAASYSQNARFTLALENVALTDVFSTIRKSSEFTFIYNMDDVRNIRVKSINVHEATIQEILDEVLRNTGFVYQIEDYVIVIQPQETKEEKKSLRLKGWVRDKKKEPLPGVTVRMVGVSLGTATNAQGWFAIDLPVTKGEVEFSFVGYKKQKIAFTEKTDTLQIVMEEDMHQVDEVVVTGIFNKPKESFTGAVTAISKEDIKMHYSRNILQTLANIDPSLRIMQDNKNGSNPNVLPEIQLRGASSILDITDLENQTSRPEYNRPLFIMDGFEVDMERVMDLNENEIESITVLKDAGATSLYGSRGANGVIVITTMNFHPGKLKIMYEGRVNVQIPDLNTYDNLMTAKEKFETEKMYGVWDKANMGFLLPNGKTRQEAHDEIEAAIARGVNYDWIKLPTRTGVGQTHILRFMGGEDAWTYGVDLSYQSTIGVMKGSERINFNGTMNLGYRKNKWNIRESLSVGVNNNQDSPYGDFSNYVGMNRYWVPYDEEGKPIDYFYHPLLTYGGMDNPVYDKEVGVWNKTKYLNIRSNTQVRYDIVPNLQAAVTFGINRKATTMDTFYPPSHKNFATITNLEQKGSYARGEREETEWQLRGTLNYAKTFKEKHMLTVGASAEISESTSDFVHWTATGFVADNVDHPGMSLGYPATGGTSGDKSKTRRVSMSMSANYYYDQRYFIDASITYNGASSFGENSRFSPYYSFGGGWLMSNESFIQNNLPFINNFRLRYSVGITGNMTFSPEVAMEVFNRNSAYVYLGGICWTMGSFANPNLKQQNTLQHNVGFDLSLFNNRTTIIFNYYNKLTNNTLTDMNLSISHGFDRVKGNIGEIRNEGYELYVSVEAYRNMDKEIKWLFNANFSRNKNTVVKLSEGFKRLASRKFTEMGQGTEYIKYQEGRSLDALYGLRTVGVDPMSGQRVFLKADGVTTTLEQNAEDLVYLGESQPKINGTLSTTFAWRGFSMTIGFGVKWGGKQINTTELNKGENIFLSKNLDRRVLKYGWTKPGDQARYRNQYGSDYKENTYTCDAFVQKDNVFRCNDINLRYQFGQGWLKRYIGFESLSLSASLSDIFYFSTIERERGTAYPFSINPNFSISCTF